MEKQYEKFLNSIEDGYYEVDIGGNLTLCNDALCKIYGYDYDELIGMNNRKYMSTETARKAYGVFNKVYKTNKPLKIFNWEFIKKDGTKIDVEISVSLIKNSEGVATGFRGIVRDISERKRLEAALEEAHKKLERRVEERTKALVKINKQLNLEIKERKQVEDELKTSLKVKQILLSEIHHRVKNNLEIISSLIDLSSMNMENREKKKLLSDLSSRIHSMALIHTQLYESDRFDRVDMERHVQEMVDNISIIYGSSEKLVNLVIEASEMYLSVNQAIPSALALNEIITNSFKHAFRESKQGTINVCINNPADDTVFMRVKDDGVGISKGIDFNNTKGIGLKLVKHLIEDQLKGEICVNSDNGTEISIEFKRFKL